MKKTTTILSFSIILCFKRLELRAAVMNYTTYYTLLCIMVAEPVLLGRIIIRINDMCFILASYEYTTVILPI